MRRLPIGTSDFKELIENNLFYIDKTLLIDELWRASGKVILMPRPRRFGKTLNLSMLYYFFEKQDTDTHNLFNHTKIWKLPSYHALQGSFPVIFLSFKDIKEENFEVAYDQFALLISDEFNRHSYLLDQQPLLKQHEKKRFQRILNLQSSIAELKNSLKFLAGLLHRHTKKKVIVLFDEYDSPLHAAHVNGYYKKMVSFIRSLLTAILKDNNVLERAFLTGILRTAKEGIFSGLNNLNVFSLLNEKTADKFGFTEGEIDLLLNQRALEKEKGPIKDWYNSYRCGSVLLYNPWSLLNCVNENGELRPYWVNTSDNELIKNLIAHADTPVKQDLELLLQGKSITKEIDEAFVFPEVTTNSQALWSLLLFSGYVTFKDYQLIGGKDVCTLTIPNKEIAALYHTLIQSIFKEILREPHIEEMLHALLTGEVDTLTTYLSDFIEHSMSCFDISDKEPEKSYHLFILGLLVHLRGSYQVLSNREDGHGRYDIMLIPHDIKKVGIIIEFKKETTRQKKSLEKAADDALTQIREKKYVLTLQERGIKKILFYGIAIKAKQVLIKKYANY